MPQPRPFGTWPSPIKSQLLTQKSVRLAETQLTDAGYYWLEGRPSEQGRSVLMYCDHQGNSNEVLPKDCSVRSCAHEYGGGSYLVVDKQVYFVQAADQRVYQYSFDQPEAPQPITPPGPFRYADFCYDKNHQRLIAVQEEHFTDGREPKNTLVAIACNDQSQPAIQILASGHDFFSNPRLSPNGQELCWLTWDHPDMPWDATSCWRASVNSNGHLVDSKKVCGGDNESVFQPQWSPNGDLVLVSDRSGWWNLYLAQQGEVRAICPMNAEFATPQWVFNMSTYGFLNETTLVSSASQNGEWQLLTIDLVNGQCSKLDLPSSEFGQVRAQDQHLLCIAAGKTQEGQLIGVDLATIDQPKITTVASASTQELPTDVISEAQPFTFTSGANEQVHSFFYPPRNSDFCGEANETPPLIVMCHGGPTGATSSALNLKIQYWTSRGFAVVDVNYRGSTGFGRTYRDGLKDSWGIKDVEDVKAAVDAIVAKGWADPARIAIKGGSAGGYTVLAALTFTDRFTAGASHYGIGDLETLARDTHKFESRYLDRLVGPYPEKQAIYRERSPIHFTDQLSCPIIFFQGEEDKVVPPSQAEAMVSALDAKGLPVAYVPFAGEGHGFRFAENIERSLDGEWSFYGQVFGFAIPEEIEPVAIRNLPESG